VNASTAFAAKHRQVFEIMRNRIESGDYRPGDRIPSEALLIQEFGVSRPTVARALQDLERRGLVNRRRGAGTYVSHSKGNGKHFGLLIPGLGDTEVFEPICGEMARVAQQAGHSLVWGAAHSGNGQFASNVDKGAIAWDLCQRFVRDRVGGVFFAPLEFIPGKEDINRRIATALDAAHIPLVLLDRDYVKYPGRSNHDLVGINNRRVGHTITDHMFAAGCKRPVFVLRPGSASTIHARAAGFAEAFITRRAPFNIDFIHECDPSDTAYIRQILRTQKPDGIVCGNDVTAGYLLHTLEELAVRVPDDVMIGGIDDVKYAELLRVPLTTVRQPFAAIGDAAYHAMFERIERPNAAPRHITLGCELVIRDSTRPKKYRSQRVNKPQRHGEEMKDELVND
jgi:GntR family transcriptional regulator of arabinose operon